ncbi:unnamed protein product, partial [Soboliphyme baturini]|uniref:Integrase catalytic domain-containing protein n=1 Tax=Soboliphyme baturini TaxID=241478 RepID=A0A183J677_9BILA
MDIDSVPSIAAATWHFEFIEENVFSDFCRCHTVHWRSPRRPEHRCRWVVKGEAKLSADLTEERIHGCAALKDRDVMETINGGVRTYLDVFRHGYNLSRNGYCIGSRPPNHIYKWLSYEEVYEVMQELGSGLVASGLEPGKRNGNNVRARRHLRLAVPLAADVMFRLDNNTTIGVYSQNRPEWLLLALSA